LLDWFLPFEVMSLQQLSSVKTTELTSVAQSARHLPGNWKEYQTDAEVARRLARLNENMNIGLARLDVAHALVATHIAKATPQRL
jgi:hypothetical protein